MNSKRLALLFTVAAMTLAGGATADEIYKWTDEDGNVYYEDRPTGAPTEERLQMTYSRTDSDAVRGRVQANVDARTARQEARAAAEKSRQEAAESAAEAAEREQRCDKARARLETYLQSRRLYRTDSNGERVYLDDAQREEARQKAEEQVTEFCS